MSAEAISAIAANLLTIIIAYTLVVSRISGTEVKVALLWDYLMKNALSQAVTKGVVSINSPVRVTSRGMHWFEDTHLKEKILAFYSNEGRKMNDHQLFMEISNRFGDQILNEISLPHSVPFEDCVVAAVHIAKGEVEEV